eukprot:g45913.t1
MAADGTWAGRLGMGWRTERGLESVADQPVRQRWCWFRLGSRSWRSMIDSTVRVDLSCFLGVLALGTAMWAVAWLLLVFWMVAAVVVKAWLLGGTHGLAWALGCGWAK